MGKVDAGRAVRILVLVFSLFNISIPINFRSLTFSYYVSAVTLDSTVPSQAKFDVTEDTCRMAQNGIRADSLKRNGAQSSIY